MEGSWPYLLPQTAVHFACANKPSCSRSLVHAQGSVRHGALLPTSYSIMPRVAVATYKHNPTSGMEKQGQKYMSFKITTACKSLNPSPSGRTQEQCASKLEAEWAGVIPQGKCWTCSIARERGIKCTLVAFLIYKVTEPQRLWNQSNEMQTTSFRKVILIANSVVFKPERMCQSGREGWIPLRSPAMLVGTTSGYACLNSCSFINISQPDDTGDCFSVKRTTRMLPYLTALQTHLE